MSLKRVIKAHGFKDFMRMGFAVATSKKIIPPPKPKNEHLRRTKVAEAALIGQDLAQEFEIFCELGKMVSGASQCMVNILDGENQFTIGGSGLPVDPLLPIPQKMTMCQFALLSPAPFIVDDLSADERFADSIITKPPIDGAAYAGFPLNTPDGVVLGTFCIFHAKATKLTDEQIRTMSQIAKAVSDHILYRIQGANFTASRLSAMLNQFKLLVPEATIEELISFLDFCAYGTTSPDNLIALQHDGIIDKIDDGWMLSQNGSDLKARLGLTNAGYRGHQSSSSALTSQFDDLLNEME